MLQLPGRGPTNKFHGVYGVSANGFGSLGRVDSGVLGISSHPIHVFNHLGGGPLRKPCVSLPLRVWLLVAPAQLRNELA